MKHCIHGCQTGRQQQSTRDETRMTLITLIKSRLLPRLRPGPDLLHTPTMVCNSLWILCVYKSKSNEGFCFFDKFVSMESLCSTTGDCFQLQYDSTSWATLQIIQHVKGLLTEMFKFMYSWCIHKSAGSRIGPPWKTLLSDKCFTSPKVFLLCYRGHFTV